MDLSVIFWVPVQLYPLSLLVSVYECVFVLMLAKKTAFIDMHSCLSTILHVLVDTVFVHLHLCRLRMLVRVCLCFHMLLEGQ